MARIFAARHNSPGSSTVVFTVSLLDRFAANTLSSLTSHTAERQAVKTFVRVHISTLNNIDMQA